MNTLSTARLCRPVASCIAAAALSVLAGCHGDGGGGMDNGNTNSSAVSAPNTSTVKEGDNGSTFDTTQYFPHGVKGDGVLMVEAMGPRSVRMQKEAQYTFKVTNMTDAPVHNVMLSSTNPEGFQVTGAGGSTTQPSDKGMMGYAVGDLAPRESKTLTVTGMATKLGMVDTCYTATFNPPTLCTMVQVTNPAIALEVQAQPDMDVCKQATYTYTVTNTGTGTAKNVTLQEDLPDGLMTTDGKQQVMANLGDIPQGEKRTATAMLKASKTGSFTGQARAMTDGDAAQPVPTVTAVHAPVLAVAVATDKASDYVGRQVPFKVTVTNKGDAPATNAKLQVRHSNGTVTATGFDNNGMMAIGDLAVNESKTVEVDASSTTGGAVTVLADASADCATAVSGNAQTTFNTIPALLLETVDEHDPVTVGQNVTYDIKVTNQGSGPDNNVAVKAMIPDGEEYVSSDGPTQPAVDGSNLTFPTIPTLAPKQSVTWKVTVKAAKATDVQFRTTATCDGTAPAEKTEPTKLIGQ